MVFISKIGEMVFISRIGEMVYDSSESKDRIIGAGKMALLLCRNYKGGIVKPENLGASDVYEPF